MTGRDKERTNHRKVLGGFMIEKSRIVGTVKLGWKG